MNKGKYLDIVIIIGIVIFAFFYPVSFGGQPLSTFNVVIEWALFGVILILYYLRNPIDKVRIILSIILMAYLGVATYLITLSGEFRISIARIAIVFLALAIMIPNIKIKMSFKFLAALFDLLMIIIITINVLSMLQIPAVKNFLVQYYTQYIDYITANFITLYRPIGFFGVGNIASFFYAGMILMANQLNRRMKSVKYYIYIVVLVSFCILIRNTTSLGLVAILSLYLIYSVRKSKYMPIVGLCILIAFVIFVNSSLFSDFLSMIEKGANGFFPRYLDGVDGLYKDNLRVVQNFPLGIGFTLPNVDTYTIYFADSGYLISYTMGNFVQLILLYVIFIHWVVKNVRKGEDCFVLLMFVFLMELGFITFYALRTVCFLLLIMIYYSSLQENDVEKTTSDENRIDKELESIDSNNDGIKNE